MQRRQEEMQRRQDDLERRRAEDELSRSIEEARLAQLDAQRARMDAMMTLVNDDKVELSADEIKVINDKNMRMMPNGEVVRRLAGDAREVIRRSGQFSRANILPNLSKVGVRRRKKTKTDKNMSKALRLANERFRKKNGSLRKGATQAKIMRYAHRLLKKM